MASALPILKCIANVEAIGSDIRIGSANAIGSVDDCSNQLLLPKSRLCDGGSTNPYRFKVLRPHHSDTSMHSVTLLFAGQVEELLRGLQVDGYVRQPNAFGFGPELLRSIRSIPTGKKGLWASVVNDKRPPAEKPPWRAVLYTKTWQRFNLDADVITTGIRDWISHSISQPSPSDPGGFASMLRMLLRKKRLLIQVEDLCLLERDPPLPQQFRHCDVDPEESSSHCVTLPMVMVFILALGPDSIEAWPPCTDPHAERRVRNCTANPDINV